MLNIKKEIKEIFQDNKSVDSVLEELLQEKRLFDMKLHLIKVLSLCDSIENLSNLKELNHDYIDISFEHDYEAGNILNVKFVKDYPHNLEVNNAIREVRQKAYALMGMPDNFFNSTFNEGIVEKFNIEPNVSQAVSDLLLSEEIKVVFNYEKMNLSLHKEQDNTINTKKNCVKL